jgi:hypothetical protein
MCDGYSAVTKPRASTKRPWHAQRNSSSLNALHECVARLVYEFRRSRECTLSIISATNEEVSLEFLVPVPRVHRRDIAEDCVAARFCDMPAYRIKCLHFVNGGITCGSSDPRFGYTGGPTRKLRITSRTNSPILGDATPLWAALHRASSH